MPDTTPRGIVFPLSGEHTRLWDHLQALADSANDALDAIDRVAGVTAERTSDASFGTSDAVVVTAPAVTVDGATKLEVTIDWLGITPNAGVTVGRIKIKEDGALVKTCRFVTDAALTGEGGSLHYVTPSPPSAGAHVYTFEAIRESGPAGSVIAASAGAASSITVKQFR